MSTASESGGWREKSGKGAKLKSGDAVSVDAPEPVAALAATVQYLAPCAAPRTPPRPVVVGVPQPRGPRFAVGASALAEPTAALSPGPDLVRLTPPMLVKAHATPPRPSSGAAIEYKHHDQKVPTTPVTPAGKKRRKCGLCGQLGHNARTCVLGAAKRKHAALATACTGRPKPKRTRAPYKCGKCGLKGHNSATCGKAGKGAHAVASPTTIKADL